MNDYMETSLYDVLDRFDTPRLQMYLLCCQEEKEFDGVRVAANILRVRFINGEYDEHYI